MSEDISKKELKDEELEQAAGGDAGYQKYISQPIYETRYLEKNSKGASALRSNCCPLEGGKLTHAYRPVAVPGMKNTWNCYRCGIQWIIKG